MSSHLVIFGVSGAIGSALAEHFLRLGHKVTGVSRTRPASFIGDWIGWNHADGTEALSQALKGRSFSAAVWAQGMNGSDNPKTFDRALHQAMYDANVLYIIESLQTLLAGHHFEVGAKLCLISSA